MQTQQNQNNDVWPFAFINGERTQASQELMDSKQYKTKDVFSTDDYEEATF